MKSQDVGQTTIDELSREECEVAVFTLFNIIVTVCFLLLIYGMSVK
jgi:hypothetical protein